MVAVLKPANADGGREADDERDEQDRDRGATAASHGSITAAVAAGRRFAESAPYTPRMAANRALRELPSVDVLLRDPRFAAEPRALALAAVRRALERAREEIRAGHDPGELVEIGDGFRIPEVLERSGARLVEVGSTNRTRVDDYERAVGMETALILRVHQSNFRQVGFTERPALSQLAEIAKRFSIPLVD